MGFHWEASAGRLFRFLFCGLLLCQTFGRPAICAENKSLPESKVAIQRGTGSGNAPAKLSGESALLAMSDFSSCDPNFGSFDDHAYNYLLPDPLNGQRCVAGIGANHVTYGKLMTHPFPVTRDVWMIGYVYFPVDFQLPAISTGPNGICYGGVHLWRLHESLTTSSNSISMDFNVPAGLDVIQFYVFRDEGSKSFVKNTSYRPAKLKGQWQYWQVHINLGTPGNSDGFLRFYAAHKLVDSMENQPFLPAGADSTWGFSYADLQSNIGGCTARWPVQNSWLVGGVRVCNGVLC